jgi:hypothetical protein
MNQPLSPPRARPGETAPDATSAPAGTATRAERREGFRAELRRTTTRPGQAASSKCPGAFEPAAPAAPGPQRPLRPWWPAAWCSTAASTATQFAPRMIDALMRIARHRRAGARWCSPPRLPRPRGAPNFFRTHFAPGQKRPRPPGHDGQPGAAAGQPRRACPRARRRPTLWRWGHAPSTRHACASSGLPPTAGCAQCGLCRSPRLRQSLPRDGRRGCARRAAPLSRPARQRRRPWPAPRGLSALQPPRGRALAHVPVQPASTMKVVTPAVALDRLGPASWAARNCASRRRPRAAC